MSKRDRAWGCCRASSNASWIIVTWDPPEQNERHDYKHHLHSTSLAHGKKTLFTNTVNVNKTLVDFRSDSTHADRHVILLKE